MSGPKKEPKEEVLVKAYSRIEISQAEETRADRPRIDNKEIACLLENDGEETDSLAGPLVAAFFASGLWLAVCTRPHDRSSKLASLRQV